MLYDRDVFFDTVRSPLFDGNITQRQVDGMNYLLDVWEENFLARAPDEDTGTHWLAYCLATAYHETDQKMRPIEEYGRGEGHEYGEPSGPYEQVYYGRGHVQLTWEANYQKGEDILEDRYDMDVPLHEYPHRMLEDEPSALILFDGMIEGWFTGVGLPAYFNENEEDPVNARKTVNGLDQAEKIARFYDEFKKALVFA